MEFTTGAPRAFVKHLALAARRCAAHLRRDADRESSLSLPTAPSSLARSARRGAAAIALLALACSDEPSGPPTPQVPEEARALWVSRFEWTTAADIDRIMADAKRGNFNLVYFQVRGAGDAWYHSALEPCAVRLCGALGNGFPSWDPLSTAIAAAHGRGIELHAWLNALTGWPSSSTTNSCATLTASTGGAPQHMLLDHPDWAMVASNGTVMRCDNSAALEYAYVSPGIPAVRTHLAAVAADVARRYAVDGIHLDRIRYPSEFRSYDTPSLDAFRAIAGRAPTSSTADAAWNAFRRDQVTLAVRAVRDSIDAARRGTVLSAAVWAVYDRAAFPDWPIANSGLFPYFQDPRAWALDGSLDVNVPMAYFDPGEPRCSWAGEPEWRCLLDDHLQGFDATTGRHTYMGFGADRELAEFEEAVTYGRERGVKGFAFFSYSALRNRGHFDALGDGLFREPAVIPAMSWR